jgi:DNA-binding MarR family transcriptional regulator
MPSDSHTEIRQLLDRLCRLAAAEEWTADLNPSQRAALAYLARANRFSRAPSQVAEHLSSTRGTISQTLKALHRKGYVAETRSETDRRSISYDVTKAGLEALRKAALFEEPLARYSARELADLSDSLKLLLHRVLQTRGNRPFGICRECIHHRIRQDTRYCDLLDVKLRETEAEEICFEQVS